MLLDIIVIAHTSHWLVNLMYTVPVVAFLGWLGVTTLRERRADAKDDE